VYLDKTKYKGPLDPTQILLKKYCPFFFSLLNINFLQLNTVTFTSFSYLVDEEVKFSGQPFQISYTHSQPYTKFQFNNVVFEDLAIEARYILKLEPMTFLGIDPSRLQTLLINGLTIRSSAFINGAGVFGQHLAKTESSGVISLQQVTQDNCYMNNSVGILNFWTASQIIVRTSVFTNNEVNATYQFYVNTLDMSDVSVSSSKYTIGGRLIHTQPNAPQAQPI
jgi:hypothetical protein